MRLSDLFAQPRSFYSEEKILQFISSDRRTRGFKLARAKMLLIFDTSKQRTWLVADDKHLHCVSDWSREPEPKLRWSIGRSKIVKNDRISLDIGTADHTGDIGYVRIDGKKPRFYSKRLFTDKPIGEVIRELLAETLFDRA
ncbi:hypothetical protein ACYZX9_14865 [Sphingomonas citri]